MNSVLVVDKAHGEGRIALRADSTAESVSAGLIISEEDQPSVIVLRGIFGERGGAIVERFRAVNPFASLIVLATDYSPTDAARFIGKGANVYALERGADVRRLVAIGGRVARRRRRRALRHRSTPTLH